MAADEVGRRGVAVLSRLGVAHVLASVLDLPVIPPGDFRFARAVGPRFLRRSLRRSVAAIGCYVVSSASAARYAPRLLTARPACPLPHRSVVTPSTPS